MDGYLEQLRKSELRKEDYARYFARLSCNYHNWVRHRYLIDPNDPLLVGDIYRSGLSGVISQQLGGPGLLQWENEFARAMYELAALDCTGMEYLTDRKTVLSCMLTGDFAAAEKLLSAVPAEDEPRVGSQCLELRYLKKLYLAVIRRDETAFNAEIVRRVKGYRRNPYTHTVVIDFPLVALIKIAGRNGIAYREDVAEIPKAMLAEGFAVPADCPKPPLCDEASALFGVYSG